MTWRRRVSQWLLRLSEWLDPPRDVTPVTVRGLERFIAPPDGSVSAVAFAALMALPMALRGTAKRRERSDLGPGEVTIVIETGGRA